jgi:hypothetical protein
MKGENIIMKLNKVILLLCLLASVALMLCFVSCTEETPTPEQPPVDGETPDGGSGEPAPHVHAFGNWTVIKKATCGSKGQRLRLCPCGERETESVPATELHICGANNKCTVCDKEWEFSEGLSYELNADGLSYTVVGYESDFGQELVLPCYYKGLPVTAIGPDAFRGVETMISADLTDYIVEIGASAFEDCSALATVRFDKNSHLTVVGERAFAGTAITAFEVPASVVVTGYGTFAKCRALETLTVAEGNSRYAVTKNGCLVDIAACMLLRMSAMGEFPADQKISRIAPFAFDGCGANEIIIPASVVAIEKKAFQGSGSTLIGFEKTDGWLVTDGAAAADGVAVDVLDKSANTEKLTETLVQKYWYRVED